MGGSGRIKGEDVDDNGRVCFMGIMRQFVHFTRRRAGRQPASQTVIQYTYSNWLGSRPGQTTLTGCCRLMGDDDDKGNVNKL